MSEYNNRDHKKESILGKIRASFSGRKFRSGAYTSLLSIIVIVIVLFVNLVVSKLDIKKDLSTEKMYTLSSDTIGILDKLENNITIYYMVETGKEEAIFKTIASQYDNRSSKITLETKDPVLYPKFASEYTEEEISQNSFIVVNQDTGSSRYIASNEMVIQEFDYNTYNTKVTGIDVEGKLTSAIQYVANPNLPVMYQVTGHGEIETGSEFASTLNKQNITIQSLSTLKVNEIPEDCDILFINSPQKDFSEDEVTMIEEYLNQGGNVVITVDYTSVELVNFNSLLNYYGVKIVNGIIYEGDKNMHISRYPHYIVPDMISHDITQKAIDSKLFAFVPFASGLQVMDDVRSSLKVEPLLRTSDSAYSKVDKEPTTVSKEQGDIDGPFYVGLAASDTYNNVTSHMVVFSSQYVFNDGVLQSYANGSILTGTLGYLAGDAAAVSIPTKSMVPEYISLTQQQSMLWGMLVVIIIPVFILVTGIVISVRRRKK